MLALSIIQFLGGLALLLGGGEALVRGAAGLARSLGVPPVVIGLTVVAFGTSAPEFVIGVTGAATGAGGLVFGNVVGASIVNIALILGLAAVIQPITVHPSIVTREIPMLLLATLAASVLVNDELLGGESNCLERGDGLILCLLFAVFLYYTVMALRRLEGRDAFVKEAKAAGWRLRFRSTTLPVALMVAGGIGLALGGNLLVNAAVDVAGRLGMTTAAVGLTVVSLGTALPELAASMSAVRRGEVDLAVGNIVGSNIFNILAVLGVATVVGPMEVPARGPIALVVATGLVLMLLLFVRTAGHRIARGKGMLLLAAFIAYMAWVILL